MKIYPRVRPDKDYLSSAGACKHYEAVISTTTTNMVVSEYYFNNAVYLSLQAYSSPLLTAQVSDWTLDFLVLLGIEVIS